MTDSVPRRLTLLAAGLSGALGVALSAMAAHAEETRLVGTAAAIALAHAPALIGIHAGYDRIRTAGLAALVMFAGVALFVADLMFRRQFNHGLFAMSAPAGGLLMIAGWLALAAGALFAPRKP